VQVVVQALEETLAEVHIADRVDALGELHAARHLPVAVGPVVLDTFHVPLIHYNDNSFALDLVDMTEKFHVFLVDKDSLELGEEDVCGLDKPVHH